MTTIEAIEILTEVQAMDDSMYAYDPKYNEALVMAINALKAQEPRVMSEVELREIQAEIPVWIEVPFEGCDFGHWVVVGYNHYEYKGVKYSFDEGALEGMCVTWRPWTSRPTNKQREAKKWDD